LCGPRDRLLRCSSSTYSLDTTSSSRLSCGHDRSQICTHYLGDGTLVLVIVWEHKARPERMEEFATIYRPDGAWVELFKRRHGFVSDPIMSDVRARHRFMIAER